MNAAKQITRQEAAKRALQAFEKVGIAITSREAECIEVADFGLSQLAVTGLQILTYVNTQRCCAKELVLLAHQTCPEHRHPSVNGVPGKEETFRCRSGEVYLYVEGDPTPQPKALPPAGGVYTVFHEIVLTPGEQYTLAPDTKHWFRAGENGAIISEFSTRSTDENDVFTDTRIVR